jgi:hypothetical protein
MVSCRPPAEPTRMKISTPTLESSSTAMEAEGPPIPVEHTPMGMPPAVPRKPRNSRLRMVSSELSNRAAIRSARAGSPGIRQ